MSLNQFERKMLEIISAVLPTKMYLKLCYRIKCHDRLNLKEPKTLNEKLNWLKFNCVDPKLGNYVDKYKVKAYIESEIGTDYVLPVLGVWKNADDIEINDLPSQFVLKCNHDSGSVFVCKDKKKFDFEVAKRKLNRALKKNLYNLTKEYPYKYVKPLIFAEKYINLDEKKSGEYKFFCFNGKVDWVMVCLGKAHDHGINGRSNDGFDREFHHLPVQFSYPNRTTPIEQPEEWGKMISIAEKLAKKFLEVRVDFYLVSGKIYFGELTFFHDAGFCNMKPKEWNEKLGKNLALPKGQ